MQPCLPHPDSLSSPEGWESRGGIAWGIVGEQAEHSMVAER